jgi:hypothetical protein
MSDEFIAIGEDMVGAAITMPRTVEDLRSKLGLGEAEIEHLTVTGPRRAVLR